MKTGRRSRLNLKQFNNQFSKIIDDLELSGLKYNQIEDVLIHTYETKRTEKMISMININWTQKQISEHFNVSEFVVCDRLGKYYTKKMDKAEYSLK
jgi:hypothetical protein